MKSENLDSFLERYRGMHIDQLIEIFRNREGLVEEARSAIESVVKERGIDVNAEIKEIENEQRAIKEAKQNVPSRWLIGLHLFAFALPATLLLSFVEIGAAISDALLAMAAAALGWWASTRAVKSVYKLGIKKSRRTLILLLLPLGYIALWLAIIAMIVNLK